MQAMTWDHARTPNERLHAGGGRQEGSPCSKQGVPEYERALPAVRVTEGPPGSRAQACAYDSGAHHNLLEPVQPVRTVQGRRRERGGSRGGARSPCG